MVLDANFLQNMINSDNPIQVVWDQMFMIWQVESYPKDVVAFYNDRETHLNQFEHALYYGYFEIYDLLMEQAQHQDGSYVLEKVRDDSVVIIADSLSVREVGLLRHQLSMVGWHVEVKGFAVAPFPTLTESLSEKLLGTNPANGRDTAHFRYLYTAGPVEVPNLPVGRSTLVWLRLPDKELEQVTTAQATTVDDALKATVETLIRLLEQVDSQAVFITSDHGYLYATSHSHYWEMPRGTEDIARKVFPRERRAQSLSKEDTTILPRNGSIEQSHFAYAKTYVGIRGRYWWASAGPNDRCTAHGGLSFAESLVPIIMVQKI